MFVEREELCVELTGLDPLEDFFAEHSTHKIFNEKLQPGKTEDKGAPDGREANVFRLSSAFALIFFFLSSVLNVLSMLQKQTCWWQIEHGGTGGR